MSSSRRQLILGTGAGLASASLVKPATAATKGKTYKWTMVTSWADGLPGLGRGPVYIKENIERMSEGRLIIDVKPAGSLVGALEVFDAVVSGKAQCGHSASYYWNKKHPATQFFTTVPFGLNSMETMGWLKFGGGQQLWDELYAGFGLKAFPAGNTSVQMGGWFNRRIDNVEDLRGLKMRIPGLGGEVLTQLGVQTVNIAGNKIYDALKSKEIEAAEWVSPYNDLEAKFYEVAQYYYYPGWHEPATTLEFMIKKELFDELPKDLQAIVEQVAYATYTDMLANYSANNTMALATLVQKHNVKMEKFSAQILGSLGKISRDILSAIGQQDKLSQRIYTSYYEFRKQAVWWSKISDEAYASARGALFTESFSH